MTLPDMIRKALSLRLSNLSYNKEYSSEWGIFYQKEVMVTSLSKKGKTLAREGQIMMKYGQIFIKNIPKIKLTSFSMYLSISEL